MTPVLGSTKRSVLVPRPAETFVPAPGGAPADAAGVGHRDFTFTRGKRRLPVRVWYPAAGDGRTPAAGRFPLMLFSHGLTSAPGDYAAILTAWARAGIMVAGPTYPHTSYGAARFDSGDIAEQPHDASAVLTALLAMDDPLAAHIDPARLGAGGHSAGAITTAGLFSRYRDTRLTAGVLVAGTDFRSTPFTGPPAGLLFVHGRKDATVSWAAARTVFAAVPWSRAMLTLPAGRLVLTGADLATAVRTSTEFLRWALYGDAAARARTAPGGSAGWDDQL
jgi:poly(3-hydroxybutyrate) depolymerase